MLRRLALEVAQLVDATALDQRRGPDEPHGLPQAGVPVDHAPHRVPTIRDTAGGVFVIDGDAFTELDFIATGIGTHGLYPSRDGTKLYVANRGSAHIGGPPHGPGSVTVIDFASRKIEATWPIPGGGSPDMGNVSADGRRLWLAGRYDNVVYAIDTTTGQVTSIPVGKEPHGLTVWPQPGRYSLGHTGNLR
jgi:YVTN family beta-propeller protein